MTRSFSFSIANRSQILPAMCEFPAVLSDSDGCEDPAVRNTSNAVLDAVSNFRCGQLLGKCLSDVELGRLALTCHFALDCLGDLWGTTVEGDGYLSEGYGRDDVCGRMVSTNFAVLELCM